MTLKANLAKANNNNKQRSSTRRAKGGHVEPDLEFSKRLSLDVSPAQFKALGQYCLDNDSTKAKVLRALIECLEDSKVDSLVQDILEELRLDKENRTTN